MTDLQVPPSYPPWILAGELYGSSAHFAGFANLAALKADPTDGDAASVTRGAPTFGPHTYVTLGDKSLARFNGTAWEAYTPPTPVDAVDLDAPWVIQDAAPTGNGELQATPTALLLHTSDNNDVDRRALLLAVRIGDNVHVTGQNGSYVYAVTAPPTVGSSIVTLTGTRGESGTPPSASDGVQVTVQRTAADEPDDDEPGDEPDDEPDDDDDDDDVAALFDPSTSTIAEVQAHIESCGDPNSADVIAETQRVLDAERADANRATLVAWLDRRPGVI